MNANQIIKKLKIQFPDARYHNSEKYHSVYIKMYLKPKKTFNRKLVHLVICDIVISKYDNSIDMGIRGIDMANNKVFTAKIGSPDEFYTMVQMLKKGRSIKDIIHYSEIHKLMAFNRKMKRENKKNRYNIKINEYTILYIEEKISSKDYRDKVHIEEEFLRKV